MPLAPAKSALMPESARALAGEAPRLVDLGSVPDMNHDLAQNLFGILGKDQIVPACGGLDSLGEGVESRSRLGPARVPQMFGEDTGRFGVALEGWRVELRTGHGLPCSGIYGRRAQTELRDQRLDLAVQIGEMRLQGALP